MVRSRDDQELHRRQRAHWCASTGSTDCVSTDAFDLDEPVDIVSELAAASERGRRPLDIVGRESSQPDRARGTTRAHWLGLDGIWADDFHICTPRLAVMRTLLPGHAGSTRLARTLTQGWCSRAAIEARGRAARHRSIGDAMPASDPRQNNDQSAIVGPATARITIDQRRGGRRACGLLTARAASCCHGQEWRHRVRSSTSPTSAGSGTLVPGRAPRVPGIYGVRRNGGAPRIPVSGCRDVQRSRLPGLSGEPCHAAAGAIQRTVRLRATHRAAAPRGDDIDEDAPDDDTS